MKKLLTMFCMVGMFLACNKDKSITPPPPAPTIKQSPTLKKDTLYSDRAIVVPKIDTVIASIVMNTKDALGMTPIGSNIRFTYKGAFKPSDDLRNVYFVVKDGATIIYTSEKKLTVSDVVNSFSQTTSPGFAPTKVYVIEVHADVLSSATDGTGVEDQCTVLFELIYQSDGSSTNKTLSETGQVLTFSTVPVAPTSTLQTMVDASTPRTDTITGSQEIELLRTKMVSIGGTSVIDDLTFSLSDANASAVVSTLKVYDGAILIGSGPVSGQSVTVSVNLNSPVNVSKIFSVKAVIGTVNVNASSSSLKITLDNVSYRDPSNVAKNNDTDRVSNSFVLLKAKQIITSIPLSGTLQNGVLADGNKITILSVGGNTATKQLTYKVTLTDNAPHTDSLSCKNLYFKIGGTLVNAKFTNSAGQIIDSVGPGDGIVRITFSVSGLHEYINPVGLPVEYVLGGKFIGFNHQAQDGDVGAIELIKTDTPTNYRIINSGVAPNNISAKLSDTQSGNSNAVVVNYAWSDISSGPAHSFAFGSGTPDAKNASIGVVFNTNPQVWLRR